MDLSSTIWLKAATLSIPGTPPVFSGGGKVENTPENIFSFLWRIDVVILNTMFVKSWLHLYSKVLRWNQHTNSWEKVNHHHHHLHDRHHHQNRWDAPTEKDMLSLPLTSLPSGATTTPSGPRRSRRKKKKFSKKRLLSFEDCFQITTEILFPPRIGTKSGRDLILELKNGEFPRNIQLIVQMTTNSTFHDFVF